MIYLNVLYNYPLPTILLVIIIAFYDRRDPRRGQKKRIRSRHLKDAKKNTHIQDNNSCYHACLLHHNHLCTCKIFTILFVLVFAHSRNKCQTLSQPLL